MQDRIARIRELLAEASPPARNLGRQWRFNAGNPRQRDLMRRAMLIAERYGIQAHLDAFVYDVAVAKLDPVQIEQLIGHLEFIGSALDVIPEPAEPAEASTAW